MHNTISGFGVDHNRFTLASSAHSQKQSFQKKRILLLEQDLA